MQNTKNVIVIGATSGIGRELAIEMHRRGYRVGATGRRVERLEELQARLPHRFHMRYMDVAETGEARQHLRSLIREMDGMDIIVLNAAVTNYQGSSEWEAERQVLEINVTGFTSLANFAFNYFKRRGNGQMVGITSVAALFGHGLSAAYNASKAYASIYLQGYRQKANHSDADITVTDIKPGYVESEMTENLKGLFWVSDTSKTARQIADAIERKKNHACVTKRWTLVAWMVKLTPNWIIDRL